jgi:hypothetical protein
MPRTIAPPDFASSVATNDGGMPRIDVRRDSAASTVYSADGGGDGGGPLSSYAGAAQRRRSSTYTVLSENASDVAGYEYAGATAAVEAHRLLQQRHGGDVAAADGDPDMGLAQANNRREVEYDNNRVLQRVEAAVADPTGRLRLLLDSTNADSLPGFEIAQLRGTLREIDCSRSPNLTRLPMEIGHLHRTLTALDCSHCSIASLPDEVSLLTSLRTLDCSHNLIQCLPWDCGALVQLERVNVSHNRLRFFSPSAAQQLLQNPKATCDLRGNDATLKAIVAAGSSAAASHGHLLPPHVDACSVCDKQDPRGTVAEVYVQFLRWTATLTPLEVAANEAAAQRGDGGMPEQPRSVLVPVLHPCCGPECARALYEWQATVNRDAARARTM